MLTVQPHFIKMAHPKLTRRSEEWDQNDKDHLQQLNLVDIESGLYTNIFHA